MTTIKSSNAFRGADLFSNSGYNRFDPAKPIRFYTPADDSAQGGSGGNNAEQSAGGGNNNSNNDSPDDRKAGIAEAVKTALGDLLGKNGGDKDATLTDLIKKNHGLEIQRDEAKKAALSKEDKAVFDAFRALNLSVDDVKRIVEEHGSWTEEKSKSVKIDSLKTAAGVAKMNPDLLASLDGATGVEYQVTGEGDKAAATVKLPDGSVKALADWAREKWPALESALFAAPTGPRKVTPFGKSAPVAGGKAPTLTEQIKAEEETRKNKSQQGTKAVGMGALREKMNIAS